MSIHLTLISLLLLLMFCPSSPGCATTDEEVLDILDGGLTDTLLSSEQQRGTSTAKSDDSQTAGATPPKASQTKKEEFNCDEPHYQSIYQEAKERGSKVAVDRWTLFHKDCISISVYRESCIRTMQQEQNKITPETELHIKCDISGFIQGLQEGMKTIEAQCPKE